MRIRPDTLSAEVRMRFVAVMALALASGCGGADDEEHELGPKCQALSDVCHEADEAGVEGADACHETAHGADEAACEADLDACTETCAATGA